MRKQETFRVDIRLLEAIAAIAIADGKSKGATIEDALTAYGKLRGELPEEFERLTERRGGDRRRKNA